MSIPSMYEIHEILFDEAKCTDYLMRSNIFYMERTCSDCGVLMKYYNTDRKYRCPKRNCNKKISIRQNTFFAKSKIPMHKILHIGYLWLKGDSSDSIQKATKHSKHTICDFLTYYRDLVADSLDFEDSVIGGEGIEVELDETKIAKRKYHRGHRVEGAWVLGGVERTPQRKVFIVQVPDRTKETLHQVIHEHVLPGSIILTDLWRGYSKIDQINGYSHMTVNHSANFKDPITNTHTNTIEGTWSALKRQIPIRNRNRLTIETHLWEFIWRRKNNGRLWAALLEALKEIHYD